MQYTRLLKVSEYDYLSRVIKVSANLLNHSDDLVNKVEVGQIIEAIGLVGRHFPTLDGKM